MQLSHTNITAHRKGKESIFRKTTSNRVLLETLSPSENYPTPHKNDLREFLFCQLRAWVTLPKMKFCGMFERAKYRKYIRKYDCCKLYPFIRFPNPFMYQLSKKKWGKTYRFPFPHVILYQFRKSKFRFYIVFLKINFRPFPRKKNRVKNTGNLPICNIKSLQYKQNKCNKHWNVRRVVT